MARSGNPFAVWRVLLLAAALTLWGGPGPGPDGLSGAALAQDDDAGDDDGGDDDGGDDDGGREGRGRDADDRSRDDRPALRLRLRPRDGVNPGSGNRRARAPAPPPLFAPAEIVVTNLAEADLATLQAEGFAVIERVDLAQVAVVLHRLRAPNALSLEQARDRVRAQPSGATGDFNHFYRTEQDTGVNPASAAPSPASDQPAATLQPAALPPPAACTHLNCDALSLIGWPAARVAVPHCQVTVPVGVIDTGVNAAHDQLAGADIEVVRLLAEQVDPSRAVHGTAVVALLVGQRADRAPGLIPEAQVIAVDIFGRDGGDERASVASLVQALDLLARRGVRVINLSLAGPPNATLQAALAQITGPGGITVLAAAGNGGPAAEPAFPAAYPSVLAVTAVDPRGQIYRRAGRGPHVDLAAPGVEVWSATSISGVRPQTGTSFAVPFATAAAAVLASQDPAATPGQIADRLRALVRDAGAAGPDEVFGAGLLALGGLCPAEMIVPPVE